MTNEAIRAQGNPYRCYNVRKESNNNLCKNIRRCQTVSLPACHFCIGINIRLSKSKELLIITTPIKLICKTNISYIKCFTAFKFGRKVTVLHLISKTCCTFCAKIKSIIMLSHFPIIYSSVFFAYTTCLPAP